MTPKTTKPPRARNAPSDAARDTDTASYEQVHGAPDPHGAPGKLRYPKQPHERDESAGPSGDRMQQERPPSDGQISQAAEDVESGRVDTDRRGVPSDIPTSKSK
jgi:hypothetical protein